MLAELVDGTIDEPEKLDFCEPDLVIIFEPYKKSENNSINEISISLLIYPFLDGRMTDQHYVFPLYMDAVLELLTYLTEKINELVI